MVDHGVDLMSESWGKQKSVCHFDEEFWINGRNHQRTFDTGALS